MSYKEGFLQKQGKRKVQGYKKRWFVLSGTVMKYYGSQEISESDVLGVIDMARVVSVKKNKHVKNGFEVATPTRSYYMSAKTSDEREDWMKAIQLAIDEARRLSTCSSATYSLVGDSGHTYSSVGGEGVQLRPSNPLSQGEYSVIGGPLSSASTSGHSPTYNLVGGSTSPVATYDEVPIHKSKGEPFSQKNEPESIYDVIGASSPSNTKRVPLNDRSSDSTSENEVFYESLDSLGPSMSSFMSKLSMESLDSIGSLEMTDDDDDDDTDGEKHEGDSTDGDFHVNADDALPEPKDGQKYATEKIKEFIRQEGLCSSERVDYQKIDKDFQLKLDKDTEYPAFDALKKFLINCK